MSQVYNIAVIGMGYVGLPLALALAEKFNVIGFDIDPIKIGELKKGIDRTQNNVEGAVSIDFPDNLIFSSQPDDLGESSIFLVAVPTPVDLSRAPDLTALIAACKTVGENLDQGDIVCFESTVFPGCTHEVCVPILEQVSGRSLNKDFFVGYSPERINPGDKIHTLKNVVKLLAASDPFALNILEDIYGSVVDSGVHICRSIEIAEAAKVIENIQRDVNIALMNECSLVFNKMGLDTDEVLEAARTKWNFLDFSPGLVGGHCIGVDPYYLEYKARSLGIQSLLISCSRYLNESMVSKIAHRIIVWIVQNLRESDRSNHCIGILGCTFKADVPDLRNSKNLELIESLLGSGMNVIVHDPLVNAAELTNEIAERRLSLDDMRGRCDLIVLCVGHQIFNDLRLKDYDGFFKEGVSKCIFDLAHSLDRQKFERSGYWIERF